MKAKGVTQLSGVNYERIDDDGLHISFGPDRERRQVLEVDNVVICAGQEPVRDLEDGLRRNGIDPHIIGGAAVGGRARRQAGDQAGHRTRRPPLDRDEIEKDEAVKYSGRAILMYYAVGSLASSDKDLTVADYWRYWVVQLWVEDYFELFNTVMVDYNFVKLGVDSQRIALGVTTSTTTCTRPAATTAPCTNCTSPELRWNTWLSGRSTLPPR